MLKRYLEVGPECVKSISGSFAVAWYDEVEERLVLAVDKIGQRLLFYGHQNGNFIFASYLARIIAGKLISPEINIESLTDFMRISYILGEETLFKNIKSIPPGSILSFKKRDIKVQKYWTSIKSIPMAAIIKNVLIKLSHCLRPLLQDASVLALIQPSVSQVALIPAVFWQPQQI